MSETRREPSVAVNVAVTQSAHQAQSLVSCSNSSAQQMSDSSHAPAAAALIASLLAGNKTLSVSSAMQAIAKGQLQLPQASATVTRPIVSRPPGGTGQGQLPHIHTQVSATMTRPIVSRPLGGIGQGRSQLLSSSRQISTVTQPTQTRTPSAPGQGRPTVNLNVRVINPEKKSQYETYVLRNIGSHSISTPMCLKKEILTQFGSDLVSHKLDFPVGYMKGGTKLSIRTASDVQDVWMYVRNGDNVSLWCSGVHSLSQKDQSSSGSESEDTSFSRRKPKRKKRKRVSALDEKNKRVEEIVTNLRQKHGTQYTTIQYRLWGEMVDVGTHK